MAHQLASTDLSFLDDGAAGRYASTFEVARSATEVWGELTTDRPLGWCRGLGIEWTSPRPFGVGTTRTARVLGGVIALQERFIRWQEGRRKTFVGVEMNLPLFERMLEDYLVEPAGEDRCRFSWTIVAEPTAVGRAGTPVNGALFASIFRDTRRHFSA